MIIERYPTQPRYRAVMVMAIALGMAAVSASYTFTTPTPTPPGRVSIVQYINDIGPFWPFAFGVAAVVLAAALIAHRGYFLALSATGALCLAFAVAGFIGAFASTPTGPFVGPALSVVAAVTCWTTAAAYVRSRW